MVSLEEKVATVVAKVETAKADAAKGTVSTPAGEQLVQKTEAKHNVPGGDGVPPKPAVTGVTPPVDDKTAADRKSYINLAKLEAKLHAERRQFQAEIEAFNRQVRTLADEVKAKYAQELRARAKADPAGVAKEVELDYSGWTSQILNKGESTADQKIQALVDELHDIRNESRETQEIARRREVARLNNEALATVEVFRGQVNQFLESNADQYSGIRDMGLNRFVVDMIKNHLKATGKLMSVKEASDILEAATVEAVDKFTQSKKWAERLAAKAIAAKGAPKPPRPEGLKDSERATEQSVRTVSNDMTGEAGTPSAGPVKRLNLSERIERTLANAEAKKAARI